MKQQRKAWKAFICDHVKITSIRSKLLRARFNNDGDLAPGYAKDYIDRHFPNLLKRFYDRGPGIKQMGLF